MAIKGKARRRSRARGVHVPPKPQPAVRKTPLLARTDLRRGIVIVLSLAALLGGFRIWENAGRTRALEKYVRALTRAEAPLDKALAPNSPASLDKVSRDFGQAKISVKDFKAQADAWEKDFRAAKDAVALLTPPAELAVAQEEITKGIDMYVGVARLYNLAAQDREVADSLDAAGQRKVEEKVQVAIQHAQEWTSRAADVMGLGDAKIVAFQRAWHAKGAPFGSARAPAPNAQPS